MMGIGTTELVIAAVVVALIFGPSALPKLARSIGKIIPSFKQGKIEVEREIREVKKEISEIT